jgi:hypothetical protein
MEVFESLERALSWTDPHNERVWQDVDEPEGRVIRLSSADMPGSVRDRMART